MNFRELKFTKPGTFDSAVQTNEQIRERTTGGKIREYNCVVADKVEIVREHNSMLAEQIYRRVELFHGLWKLWVFGLNFCQQKYFTGLKFCRIHKFFTR